MSLKISRILHAGYIFECEGVRIGFDPIFENPFSRNCYAFPAVRFDHAQIRELKLAAVFISHFHDDHCSLESLDFLDRNTPIFVFCVFDELISMIRAMGFVNVTSLQLQQSVTVGPFEVLPKPALDVDVDSLFHIRAAGLHVLNVVDSWIDPFTLKELAGSAPWDMVLWPFQAMRELEVLTPSRSRGTVEDLPHEWIEQLQILRPRYIVPSSCQFIHENWSWYNHTLFPISYRQFAQEVERALIDTRVVRLDPSVTVVLDRDSLQPAPSLEWISPEDGVNVDYDYRPALPPPPMSEVAKNFGALSARDRDRVFDYCRKGLLERYRTLDSPTDPYLRKPRTWRLSLYDQRGVVTHLHYDLRGTHIELVDEGPMDWLTEIPLTKLHAALDNGESLTSLYLRVNDAVFRPGIEEEIGRADIMDDPLVRCLFHGVFGAYQAAQLRRLQIVVPSNQFIGG